MDAAVAVHDRFRQAGGAAGIDDPQRLIERQVAWCDAALAGHERAEIMAPASIAHHEALEPCVAVEVAVEDDVANARQVGEQRLQHLHAVVARTTVLVAVAADEHFGLDLAEAVEHGERPPCRANTHRPDGADAGAGEKGDRRCRHVGQKGADAIAGHDAHVFQRRGEAADLAPQFWPGELARRARDLHRFVAKDDRRAARRVGAVGMAEDLLRVIDARAPRTSARRAWPRLRAPRCAAPATSARSSPRSSARTPRGRPHDQRQRRS